MPGTSSRRPSTRWPREGCTTTSEAASPATRPTASGSCRTSRRCCTTRRCCSASTSTGSPCSASPRWALVMEETVAYVLTTLRHPDGGLYSAEDADSPGPDGVGVEGLFYTWTPDEVRDAMASIDERLADPRAAAVICQWFGITDDGNFDTEGHGRRSIPNRMHARGELIRPAPIEAAKRLLLRARAARPRPGLDDKVLTEWNALMVSVLAEGGAMLQRRPWLDAAVATAEFLLRRAPRRRRPMVPQLARRRRPPSPTHGARSRPRRLDRRVHAARRGHRSGTLDRRGGAHHRDPARLVLGSGRGRAVHHGRRRALR